MGSRDRRALLIGALVVAGGLGFSRIARPAYAELMLQRTTLDDERALLARERALLVAAPSFPRAQQQVDRALAAETPRLFPGDSVAATSALAAFVANVAATSSVRLLTLEGRAPESDRGVTRVGVEVRAEATWRDALSFLRVLESSSRLVHISGVRLERGARGGPLGGALVLISLQVSGYSRSGP